MIVYRSLNAALAEQRQAVRPSVATVGYFDGIHIGHQELLRELRGWASNVNERSTVVTFSPHPAVVLVGTRPVQVLSLPHRLLLLAQAGVDATLVLPFTHELSQWSAENFVKRALVDGLGARRVLMGFDSAWGVKRQGTFEYLNQRTSPLGIELRQAGVAHLSNERVSSTLVREAVNIGDIDRLQTLLGRPPSLLGRVVNGDGRGRTIGFPTANLDIAPETPLPAGVYFARVSRWGRLDFGDPENTLSRAELPATFPHAELTAVVNIGKRPTFEAATEATVEVHLLDFDDSLYDEYLEVHFLKLQRLEQKFDSVEALVVQINKDVAARRLWRSDP